MPDVEVVAFEDGAIVRERLWCCVLASVMRVALLLFVGMAVEENERLSSEPRPRLREGITTAEKHMDRFKNRDDH